MCCSGSKVSAANDAFRGLQEEDLKWIEENIPASVADS